MTELANNGLWITLTQDSMMVVARDFAGFKKPFVDARLAVKRIFAMSAPGR